MRLLIAKLFVWKGLFKSQVLLFMLSALFQLMDDATDGTKKMFDTIDISLGIFSSSHLFYLLFIKILTLIYITRRKQKDSVFGLNLQR